MVLSPEIQGEWNNHQSSFARQWRTSMVARKKVEFIASPRDDELRDKVKATLTKKKDQDAADKDMLLIEAALATDQVVTSTDEKVRELFRIAAQKVSELQEALWANPVTQYEETIEWLEGGAKRLERFRLA